MVPTVTAQPSPAARRGSNRGARPPPTTSTLIATTCGFRPSRRRWSMKRRRAMVTIHPSGDSIAAGRLLTADRNASWVRSSANGTPPTRRRKYP